jgi:hypothetical protein
LMLAVIEEELEPLAGPDCEDLWPILDAGLTKEREQRTSSMMTLGGQLAKWLASRGAKQDLGGEPVHWRYAFTVKDADAARPAAALARATGSCPDSSSDGIDVREPSRRSVSERRRSFNRRGNDRRSPTPLTTVRRGLETVSISPAAIRKAAAFRLATAAFVGAGLIALGVTQGPLSWLAPRPDSAFALGAAKAEPYIAQPAKPEQLARAAQPELIPVVESPAVAVAVAAAEPPAEVKAEPKPAHQQLLTRSVRQPPELAQLARHAAEESDTRAEAEEVAPTKLANAEPKSERMHLEVAAFIDPKDAVPSTDAPKASEIVVASRPASNVVTVRPRAKQVLPSEAELGLKNPW